MSMTLYNVIYVGTYIPTCTHMHADTCSHISFPLLRLKGFIGCMVGRSVLINQLLIFHSTDQKSLCCQNRSTLNTPPNLLASTSTLLRLSLAYTGTLCMPIVM